MTIVYNVHDGITMSFFFVSQNICYVVQVYIFRLLLLYFMFSLSYDLYDLYFPLLYTFSSQPSIFITLKLGLTCSKKNIFRGKTV